MAKLSVLHIVGSFHQGGSERQAVQLIRLLKEEGSLSVYVACLDGAGVLRSEVEELGFDSIPEFRLSSFYDANAVRQLLSCSAFIRDNGIKLVQCHDFYTNVFGISAAALARVPARIAAKREMAIRSDTQWFVERRSYTLAHSIVVNADAVKNKLLRERVPSTKITTIYNGVDARRLCPAETDKRTVLADLGVPGKEAVQFVTILANLRSAVKNHDMFLRAAQVVNRSLPDVNFIVAGEGDLIGNAKALAADLGIGGVTHFIGRCAKIAELLSISSVCVLSSHSEGFSNAILEYMAAGKPVVATDVGGTREAVVEGETGYLVRPNDHEMMADRLIDLLQNKWKAEEFGLNGKKRSLEEFSPEKQLDRTLDLYRRLLKI